ncbi:hypothetical protein [Microvirga sp. 2TAF3]|uniref:hypothetical protein n=1 Tax=Microvirga sp. 2TAF3 TaxID=3233014 RepID=UPI003F94479F
MAHDKRGQAPEPSVEEGLDELTTPMTGEEFVAGPTTRNEVGNTKRAAAKATGLMGASKKLDPELDIDHIDDGRVRSGSNAGIRPFRDVPPENGAEDVSLTLTNEEIAESVPTTAQKSPAARPTRPDDETGSGSGGSSMKGGAASRRRVPAPGNVVDVPKGKLIRGEANGD